MNRYEFVNALKNLLSYHESCGIEGYPLAVCAEIDKAARLQVADKGPANGETAQSVSEGKEQSGSGAVPRELLDSRYLSVLEEEISSCRNCSLHRTRQMSTVGSGGGITPAKLLIVGDWLTIIPRTPVEEGDLFGREQDMMLARMISAMELSEQEVYITNVIKCSVPETSQPTSEHIGSCSSYLEMQIEHLQPQVICSMGIIASRLLTNQAKPLSQQRGHFFSYNTTSGLEIPVMPTYHPTFLLRNPEMKQATWADLQAVKKKIIG